MTTQAIACSLSGSAGQHFLLTATDLTWSNDMVDDNGLQLGEVLSGQRITGAVGSYTGGCCTFRIYNPFTKQVKALWFGAIVTEEIFVPLERSISIDKDDKLQCYPSAVTT